METIIFRHADGRQAGILEHVLNKAGKKFRYVDAYHDDMSDFNALEAELLIVMGGGMGVYQSDTYPFLSHEVKILEKRMAQDLPTLGICLGSQLMAQALGGRNYKGTHGYERGWHKINVNEAGMKTPLRHIDVKETMVMQWHTDTFDLPKDATLLASSDLYENQAFSYGKNALAIQCHPEVNPNKISQWMAEVYSQIITKAVDQKKILADTQKYCSTSMNQAEKMMFEFLGNTNLITAEKKHA